MDQARCSLGNETTPGAVSFYILWGQDGILDGILQPIGNRRLRAQAEAAKPYAF
jgi:hypothetical protein